MKITLLTFLLFTFCELFAQNKGLNFNQLDNNYILVPNNSAINVINNFTIEFWIRPSKTETWAIILQEGKCSNWSSSYNVAINSDSTLSFTFNGTGDCNDVNSYKCSTKIYPGGCLHVAISYSSAGVKFYFNGLLQSGQYTVGGYCGNLYNSSEQLQIGVYKYLNNTLGAYFDGLLDELRIWGKVLNPSEILSTYQDTLLGNETGLRLYYKFDTPQMGSGMTVTNYATTTGSALNGLTYSTNSATPNTANSCFVYLYCDFSNSIFANSPTTFCQGNNVTLLSMNQGYPFVLQWLLNGNSISGATNANYIATTTGNYSLYVDSLGCTDTSNVIQVIVNPIPSVSINSIPTFINYYTSPLILTGNPSGGTFTGDGMSGTNFNPNIAGLGAHTITYNYTDPNSCSNYSSLYTIVYDTTGIICTSYVIDTIYISVTDTLVINAVLTGVTPPNNINTFKLFPNPASTHIFIDNGNYTLMNGYSLRIDNNLSQTVFTSPINQPLFYIDLSSLTGEGLYFVNIIDNYGNTIEIRKIVLQ